jgi:hypothetical protein
VNASLASVEMPWYTQYYNTETKRLRITGHDSKEVAWKTGRSVQDWMENPDEGLPADLVCLSAEGYILSRLPSLPPTVRELELDGNAFTELVIPEGVESLYCSYSHHLSRLVLPSTLTILLCMNCPKLTKLTTTELTTTELTATNLPLLPPRLTYLSCRNCNLTELPAPLPPTLRVLSCSGNRLTALPPMPSTIEELSCENNFFVEPASLPPTLIRTH